MAKKKYYGNDSNKGNDIFSSNDKKTPVSQISNGGSGSYGDTMEYIDKKIRKNSNYKKNMD